MEKNHFTVKKITKISDFVDGTQNRIDESDLTLQGTDHVIQFEYNQITKNKVQIAPGIYTLVDGNSGVGLKELTLKSQDLLETAKHAQLINNEINVFESKLDVYKRLNKAPKRSILLYSEPGMGKTSTISKLAQERVKSNPGQVVIYWDTSTLYASDVQRFFALNSEMTPEAKNLLFIMEDIGGGNVEDHHGPKQADSALLELLDGASLVYSIPTFIIATTNCPERLLKSLADRPGRFDQMFELESPNEEERVSLCRFIAKRELTEDEINALKKSNGLSIAHLTEIVIRSELHEKTFEQVIKEMKEHSKRVDGMFKKIREKMGLNANE